MKNLASKDKVGFKLWPSAADRWINCPGSVKMSENCPRSPSSKYAAEGSAAHYLAAEFLRSGISKDDRWEGEVIEQDGFMVIVTKEMLNGVGAYCEAVLATCEAYGRTYKNLIIEEKFTLRIGDTTINLYVDAALRTGKILHIWDFKYGAGIPVEVINNKQALIYAVTLLREETEVHLGIHQPRCPHPDGPARYWEVPRNVVTEFHQKLKNYIRETKVLNPLVKPGSWCKWCPASTICPELQKTTLEIAKNDFAESNRLPVVDKLSANQLADVLIKAGILESWINAVKTEAHNRAERGEGIPGYKLIRKKKHRKWKYPKEVEKYFKAVKEAWTPAKLKSPAQLEKELTEQQRKDWIEKPVGDLALVKESHQSPAVPAPAISDFQNENNSGGGIDNSSKRVGNSK
jgi:hypothetical protein